MHVVCLIFNNACVTAIFVENVCLIKKKFRKNILFIIWYAFVFFFHSFDLPKLSMRNIWVIFTENGLSMQNTSICSLDFPWLPQLYKKKKKILCDDLIMNLEFPLQPLWGEIPWDIIFQECLVVIKDLKWMSIVFYSL